MTEITSERKEALIRQKNAMWQNTIFDAQLDAEIAEALSDEPGLEQAKERMKKAMTAVKLMEAKL